MRIGSVPSPGLVVKYVITKSSNDKVNARTAPERTPGRMAGRVTFQKARTGEAPRSWPASSIDRSRPWSRAETTTATYDRLNVVWATIAVTSESFQWTASKSARRAIARTISGTMTGRAIKVEYRRLPRKASRAASAAIVPRTVARTVVEPARTRVFPSSRCRVVSWASLRYQSTVNPVHRTEYFDSLNEKSIMTAIGA